MSASRRRMQKMIDICNEYGLQYDICFNAKKSKWFFAGKHDECTRVLFKLGDNVIDHEWDSLTYLGVKFVVKRQALVIDVNDRIKKLNSNAYSVLMNSSDLSEIVRCEIIVEKCLPVFTYGLGCGQVWPTDIYINCILLIVRYLDIYSNYP